MARPTHNAKPRIKPSTVYRGLFLCFNNRTHAYGVTIQDAYDAWKTLRVMAGGKEQ